MQRIEVFEKEKLPNYVKYFMTPNFVYKSDPLKTQLHLKDSQLKICDINPNLWKKIFLKPKNNNFQLALEVEFCKPFNQRNEQAVSTRWLISWNPVKEKF